MFMSFYSENAREKKKKTRNRMEKETDFYLGDCRVTKNVTEDENMHVTCGCTRIRE